MSIDDSAYDVTMTRMITIFSECEKLSQIGGKGALFVPTRHQIGCFLKFW